MLEPTTYRHCGALGALIVLAIGGSYGCQGEQSEETSRRRAVTHLERIDPLDLVAVDRPESDGEPAETAVRTVGSRDSVPVVPDSNLRIEIGMRLERAPLNFGAVDVVVDDQHVSLSGDVRSLKARDRAEIIARSVDGVRDVDNDLEVSELSESSADGG